MKQSALTILTPVDPAHAAELEPLLSQLGGNIAKQTLIPFDQLDRLHFMSLVLVESDKFGHQLVFESNFDGKPRDYLEQFATRARAALDEIFHFCPGYPLSGDTYAVVSYFLRHAVYTDTFYVGCVGISRPRIYQERTLREKIEAALDALPPGLTAPQIRRQVQELVRADPELQWALQPAEIPSFWERILFWLPVALAAAVLIGIIVLAFLLGSWTGLLILVAAAALFVGISYLILRKHERSDPSISDEPLDQAVLAPHEHLRALVQQEDRRPQNHLASVTTVKPGLFRLALLRTVLAAINALARYVANKGKLSGISSIHFARWAVLNQGEQLLFLSNFDGSWEHYLGEFIDLAAKGLTAVWTNSTNFPKTRALLNEGAADEQRFKSYARRSQTPAQLWYSAYPFLSVENILENAAIRRDLWSDLSSDDLKAWLRRF